MAESSVSILNLTQFGLLDARLQLGQLFLLFERQFAFGRRCVCTLFLRWSDGWLRPGYCDLFLFTLASFQKGGIIARILAHVAIVLKAKDMLDRAVKKIAIMAD